MKQFKDRIIGFERIEPSKIIPHHMNHKEHSEEQRARFRSIMKEIGFAGAIIVRKHKGKFQLIGGHMRHSEMKQPIPALILDVTEKEGTEILTMLDAIADMADTNDEAMQLLTQSISSADAEFQETLALLCPTTKLPQFDGGGLYNPLDEELSVPAPPLEQTRCIPVCFTAKQKAEFIKLITQLNQRFKTDNYSDTLLKAMKEWSKKHGKAKATAGKR
jgi:hypothetical protein